MRPYEREAVFDKAAELIQRIFKESECPKFHEGSDKMRRTDFPELLLKSTLALTTFVSSKEEKHLIRILGQNNV